MAGLAQKLFLKSGRQLPEKEAQPRWPTLDKLLAGQYLADVDYALAEHLLSGHPQSCEEAAAFICHLSIATRQGHLCVRVNAQNASPDPCALWMEACDNRSINEEIDCRRELQALPALITQGSCLLPEILAAEMNGTDFTSPSTPICRFGDLYYFQRNWAHETLIVQQLTSKFNQPPAIALDMAIVQQNLSALEQARRLQPEQANAILQACRESLTIICGGPGVGKTHTAGQLIRVYWEAMNAEQRGRCEIALAAPTGKAAANLQGSLQLAVGALQGFPAMKAQTLHSLLKIRNDSRWSDPSMEVLNADLIIVDESSMIDVRLMARLLTSIKPGARLILLGDQNQLPPVAEGMLFADMVESFASNVATLKTCLRTDLRAICDFANLVRQGEADAALRFLENGLDETRRLSLEPQNHRADGLQSSLVEYATPFFKTTDPQRLNPKELLNAFNGFRILTPLRQGPYGVERLNARLMQFFMHRTPPGSWFVAPIMVSVNDHRLELSNGEAGVLVRRIPHNMKEGSLQEGDYALFADRRFTNGATEARRLPALLLPRYEYAYCLSVHKSQGSEFDHILLLLPEGSARFGRAVLYTAATRARKKIDVWGSDATFRATVATHFRRLSGIGVRLDTLKLKWMDESRGNSTQRRGEVEP